MSNQEIEETVKLLSNMQLDQFILKDINSIENLNNKNIFLLLGNTGHGKSTFVERFLGIKNNTLSSKGKKSHTLNTTFYIKDDIILIDTPGFNDSEGRTILQMNQLVDICSDVGKITNVCFFINLAIRFNIDEQKTIAKYFEIIQNVNKTNVLFYINHCDDDVDKFDTEEILKKVIEKINIKQIYQTYFSDNNLENNDEIKDVIERLKNNFNPIISKNFLKLKTIEEELKTTKLQLLELHKKLNEINKIKSDSNNENSNKIKELENEIKILKDYRIQLNNKEYEFVIGFENKCNGITKKGIKCKNTRNCPYH